MADEGGKMPEGSSGHRKIWLVPTKGSLVPRMKLYKVVKVQGDVYLHRGENDFPVVPERSFHEHILEELKKDGVEVEITG